MVLERQRQPLRPADLPEPTAGAGQVQIDVHACGVCRSGRENLCDRARFTGYDIDGGYAEVAVADERFCFPIPEGYPDTQAAPLLCAGLIGYRALRLVGEAERIGFYGFGAAAHILCQVAVHEGRRVFAFTRDGDEETQAFARQLGAEWAGSSDEAPPEELDGAIVFAPVGALMTAALRASAKGARVISAGRRGVHRAGAGGAGPDRGRGLPAGGGQPGAGGPARRALPRRCGSLRRPFG
jgi:D-arabinose 1-dehydrogenase-like Zn-dependent alcohol dehydrogenase